MTLTNGKSTRSWTLSDATGSSIISSSGWITVTYGPAGNLQRICRMCSNWLLSSTESIRGSLNDDWTGGVGLDVLWGFYFLIDLRPVQMASARVFATSGDKSSGGGVSLCTESAVRLLIGHWTDVGLIKSCGGTPIGFVSIYRDSLIIYTYVTAQGVCS